MPISPPPPPPICMGIRAFRETGRNICNFWCTSKLCIPPKHVWDLDDPMNSCEPFVFLIITGTMRTEYICTLPCNKYIFNNSLCT